MTNCCNINFISEYCYTENNLEPMHINDYIKNNEHNIKCYNGHELILCNGKIRKPYFRHKNNEDTGGSPMTNWHCEWQSHFPITEKLYPKKIGQIKERWADVVLNNNKILEVQHSKYEKEEIDNRMEDYKLHDVEIIWLIDGNTGIDIKLLEYSNRVYLEFTEYWKYESFKSYSFIFIDINQKIYKINPDKVKSRMIDIENGKTKEEFINSLKNDTDIWDNIEPEQCNLFIKQQGAGNGKTYGIIKMLEDIDKSHYTNFIYITKQHSAKHIIKSEFENQKHNFQNLINIEIKEENKKYIIKYFNKISNKTCQIIISTIDSFTYSISNKKHTHYDMFEGLIYEIINEYITTDLNGGFKFGGINTKLNKECLLVIDEFQDPPEHYAKAIIQIMRNKYIDVFIVGDKLQSIKNETNSFTYFLENEIHLIKTIKLEPTNICRRFIHPKLIKFVNFMIPFKDYNLPEIVPYDSYGGDENEPIVFFEGKFIDSINQNEETEKEIVKEIEKIMKYYENEVNIYNRLPEDFLIVTLFTQKNPLVDALQLAINIFWNDKNSNENINIDNYYRYAIFHKSEEGSSIDLSESDKSTRIVSCHSSKGDGRPVVFLIGFNESAIKKYSGNINLVYNSIFHVAITRMKEKLYIMYQNNHDDISIKINDYIFKNEPISKENMPEPIIKDNSIKYDDIINDSKEQSYKFFYDYIIINAEIEKIIENNTRKKIIDMSNHSIRFSALYVNILLEILYNEIRNKSYFLKQQIKAVLHKVVDSLPVKIDYLKEYYNLLTDKTKLVFPIIKISNKGKDYIKYFQIIYEIIIEVQKKVSDILKGNQNILCPLECIILHYMIEISDNKQYSNININDIYDIIYLYDNTFTNETIIGHEKCLCKKHFNNPIIIQVKNKKIDEIKLYLLNHFEKIEDIKNIMKLFHIKYPKINWLINHILHYEGNDNFNIHKKFNLIGYDDEHVIISYIKPQFNSLNYNEIIVNSIFDTHFINNVKKYKNGKITDNYLKFNNKKVITCIFTLDQTEPYYIEWDNSLINSSDIIKKRMYNIITDKCKTESYKLYYFYKYWRVHCPDDFKKASKFIGFLNEKLDEIKNQFFNDKYLPKYIFKFISYIEVEMSREKKNKDKEIILNKYDNNEYFMKLLEEKIQDSVKEFLKIRNNESDSESGNESD